MRQKFRLEDLEVAVTAADPRGLALAPLVFLHEGLGSLSAWKHFPLKVREATGGRATLVYSRLGYGQSPPWRGSRDLDYMHEEAGVILPRLLDRYGINRPLIVGHSDGASIALIHAASGFDVAGIVAIAPHVVVESRTLAGIAELVESYESSSLPDRLSRHHRDADSTFASWSRAWTQPEFQQWALTSMLPDISAPVLVIQGGSDPFGSRVHVDLISATVAGPVSTLLLEKNGHAPHVEDPEQTLAAIGEFAVRCG